MHGQQNVKINTFQFYTEKMFNGNYCDVTFLLKLPAFFSPASDSGQIRKSCNICCS